jgi:hypothetical protein
MDWCKELGQGAWSAWAHAGDGVKCVGGIAGIQKGITNFDNLTSRQINKSVKEESYFLVVE